MQYKIEYDTIMPIVEEVVSREASQAYSEDGTSLYDGIRMISRDEDEKKRIMSEVLSRIQMQCNRFVRHAAVIDSEGEPLSWTFELELSPRRSVGKGSAFETVFRSLTENLVLNKYFASKNQTDLAPKYDALALNDVQMLNKLLYEKLPPVYPTIYEKASDNNNI